MPRPIKAPTVYEDLTYALIGIAFSIHKQLGPIHKELIYQKAFAHELTDKMIPFTKEKQLPVSFKGEKVGVYIPDFLIDDKVIVEIKALEFIPQKAGVQLSYYLKNTGYRVGLLINFGTPKLQVRRRIYG